MTDLLEGILEHKGLARQRFIHLSIFDGQMPSPDALLYESLQSGRLATPETARLTRTTIVITELADDHAGLASHLEALVEAYDYDSLHALLATCGAETPIYS